MKSNITPRQQEVLDTIESLTKEHDVPPTFRELMEPLGIRSPNGMMSHLHPLRKKGLVTWTPNVARTLRLVQQPESRGMPLLSLEQMANAERCRTKHLRMKA